jgi:glycerol-3-phosphate acyltransferase PlsY
MAVLVPHNNPLFLNFRNWKQSAAVLLVIAVLCFATALLI